MDNTEANRMAVITISVSVDARPADDAKKIYGVRSRAEAVPFAVCEFVGSRRSKDSTKKNGIKLSFASHRD
jgi:hypothetical protein